jgi:hypothetical protein
LIPAGLFCALRLVFTSAFNYSEWALGQVLKGMPWLADNPDSYELLHLWLSVHVLIGDEKLFDG